MAVARGKVRFGRWKCLGPGQRKEEGVFFVEIERSASRDGHCELGPRILIGERGMRKSSGPGVLGGGATEQWVGEGGA